MVHSSDVAVLGPHNHLVRAPVNSLGFRLLVFDLRFVAFAPVHAQILVTTVGLVNHFARICILEVLGSILVKLE